MKKMFTLLISGLMFTTAFAQNGPKEEWNGKDRYDDPKDEGSKSFDKYDKHDGRGNTYYFTAREKDMQINRINREYDNRILAVQSRFFMSRYDKMRQVRFLEEQRNREIRMVMDKFYDRRNKFTHPKRRGYDKW
ncbi:MAG: hypothetical protein IPJ02_01335 [Chitinophagaceae bacterium]|nr:hypothetical protein [Chitinophagaceae bacterium]